MRIRDRSCLVRSVLIVGTLLLLSQAQETAAQIDNAALSQKETSSFDIQLLAGEATSTNSPSDQFLQLLDRAIEITSKRHLTANSHSPWQIFHCILAMRQETMLRLGSEKVKAIQWLSTAEPQFDNQPWLLLTPHGAKFHPYTRMYAFEGHPSQFLALLSQSNLPLDHEFHVQGKVVTLNDLVNNTMKEVNTAEEVTWVLWALQHFLKPDATWVNQSNEPWSIERLVQIEVKAAVEGAPCGGNHRLFALTRARDKYLQSGGQLRGTWFEADQKIKKYIEIARSLQNSDGSFSNDSYKGPGHTTDVNKRFNTTGHTMEFLAIGLPKERLNESWVRNAVWMLSRELVIHRDTKIDCGPLFHSLDALILYRDRIRPKAPASETPKPPDSLAKVAPALPTGVGLNSGTNPKEKQEPSKPIPETKIISQVPSEVKLGAPELQNAPIPIPEPIADPTLKTVEPTQDPPKQTTPQAHLPKTNSPKTAAVTLRAASPKPNASVLDPSKLANVGQVAAPRKPGDSKSEPPRMPRRTHSPSAPPGLLPDLSATPLTESVLPILNFNFQPGSLGSDAKVLSNDCGRGTVIHNAASPPTASANEADQGQEVPASALEPANP